MISPTPPSKKEQQEKLVTLLQQALRQDEGLRVKYQVGDKFRFIHDTLESLLEQCEKTLKEIEKEEKKTITKPDKNDIMIFVYLYNAHGITLRSWHNMLLPKVFYEYSVNRPIYMNKGDVDALIRSKKNKAHHGYITLTVKSEEIIKPAGLKDMIGNPVIKVKENSLKFEKLIAFTHNEIDYIVDDEGTLVKKE